MPLATYLSKQEAGTNEYLTPSRDWRGRNTHKQHKHYLNSEDHLGVHKHLYACKYALVLILFMRVSLSLAQALLQCLKKRKPTHALFAQLSQHKQPALQSSCTCPRAPPPAFRWKVPAAWNAMAALRRLRSPSAARQRLQRCLRPWPPCAADPASCSSSVP